jgi:hypothetical protein
MTFGEHSVWGRQPVLIGGMSRGIAVTGDARNTGFGVGSRKRLLFVVGMTNKAAAIICNRDGDIPSRG